MIDGGEADDKIIAVLEEDRFWAEVNNIDQIPEALVDRLHHYFETYKSTPSGDADVKIVEQYDAVRAKEVIAAAVEDYEDMFGD